MRDNFFTENLLYSNKRFTKKGYSINRNICHVLARSRILSFVLIPVPCSFLCSNYPIVAHTSTPPTLIKTIILIKNKIILRTLVDYRIAL
jgi:hypothetical protein